MLQGIVEDGCARPLRPSLAALPLVMVRHPAPPPPRHPAEAPPRPMPLRDEGATTRCAEEGEGQALRPPPTHSVVQGSVVVGGLRMGDVAVSVAASSATSTLHGVSATGWAQECFLYATPTTQLVVEGGEARAATRAVNGAPTPVSLRTARAVVQRLRLCGQHIVGGDVCAVAARGRDAVDVVVALATTTFALVVQRWVLCVEAETLAWVGDVVGSPPAWHYLPVHIGIDLWGRCADGAVVRWVSVDAVDDVDAGTGDAALVGDGPLVVVSVVVAGSTTSALLATCLAATDRDEPWWAMQAVPWSIAAVAQSRTSPSSARQGQVHSACSVELLLQRACDGALVPASWPLHTTPQRKPQEGDAAGPIDPEAPRLPGLLHRRNAWRLCDAPITISGTTAFLRLQAWSAAHGLVVCTTLAMEDGTTLRMDEQQNRTTVVLLCGVFGADDIGGAASGRVLHRLQHGLSYVATHFAPSSCAVDDAMLHAANPRGLPRERCVVVLALVDHNGIDGDVLQLVETPSLQWNSIDGQLQVVGCQTRTRRRWLGQRMMEEAHPLRSTAPSRRCFARVGAASTAAMASACVLVEWH